MTDNLCSDLGISTVFVGGPFFKAVNPETGEMDAIEQKKITLLLDYFESRGCTVYNAHRRESWGKAFLTAPECVERDFTEISASDLFIAFPGDPASPGTHIEIGWASALRKPTVLLLEDGKHYTFLVTGLHAIANLELVTYQGDFGFMGGFEDAMRAVMARHQQSSLAGPRSA